MDAKERLEELQSVFEALAHPSRRQILLTIWFRGGVVSSSEIAKRFHHAWPTISRHLRVLEAAGLLTHVKDGRHKFFKVNEAKVQVAMEWFSWFDKRAPSFEPERHK